MPDTFDHEGFRDAVDRYIATNGFSARAVAQHTGLSLGALNRYLSCEGGASLTMAAGLARFCDLRLDRFVL